MVIIVIIITRKCDPYRRILSTKIMVIHEDLKEVRLNEIHKALSLPSSF